jgi:hypothetical protein
MLPNGKNPISIAPNLVLYTSQKPGPSSFVRDITREAEGWQRSLRLNGGYWIGKYTVRGKTLEELTRMFYNELDYIVIEYVNGLVSWGGYIHEMTLNTPNASRIRSLDQVWNHVRVQYGSSSITAAASTQASIDRYFQKEYIENVGDIDSTAATARRDTFLKERSWPWARPQGNRGGNEPSLDVVVCGYIFKANFKHTTTADDSTSNVGEWIDDIVGTDLSGTIYKGILAANATSIKKTVTDYTRCWDLISKLVKIGDASGNLYRAYLTLGLRLNYEQISKTPLYYIVKGQIQSNLAAAEAVNPWLVQPGVFRDMDAPVGTTEPGSYLDDMRDMIVEEVTCGVNSGLSWQALDFSESEQLAALQDALVGGGGAGGAGGGSGGRTITDEQLEKWGLTRKQWWAIKGTARGQALRASLKKKKKRG